MRSSGTSQQEEQNADAQKNFLKRFFSLRELLLFLSDLSRRHPSLPTPVTHTDPIQFPTFVFFFFFRRKTFK